MPVVEGAVALRIKADDAAGCAIVHVIEEMQLDGVAVLGEDAEIHAIGRARRAEGIAVAGQWLARHRSTSSLSFGFWRLEVGCWNGDVGGVCGYFITAL